MELGGVPRPSAPSRPCVPGVEVAWQADITMVPRSPPPLPPAAADELTASADPAADELPASLVPAGGVLPVSPAPAADVLPLSSSGIAIKDSASLSGNTSPASWSRPSKLIAVRTEFPLIVQLCRNGTRNLRSGPRPTNGRRREMTSYSESPCRTDHGSRPSAPKSAHKAETTKHGNDWRRAGMRSPSPVRPCREN